MARLQKQQQQFQLGQGITTQPAQSGGGVGGFLAGALVGFGAGASVIGGLSGLGGGGAAIGQAGSVLGNFDPSKSINLA